jgi:hypothetical protein
MSARRARAEDVAASGALLIDLDAGAIATKRDHLARHIGPASMIVASGGRTETGQEKLHLYWRLSKAAVGNDLDVLVGQRAAIARKVGGDMSFASAHQPIRVAGTIHGKQGRLTPVRILETSSLEYELSDLVQRVEEMPYAGDAEASPAGREHDGRRPGVANLMTMPIHAGAVDIETRYSALSRVIGHGRGRREPATPPSGRRGRRCGTTTRRRSGPHGPRRISAGNLMHWCASRRRGTARCWRSRTSRARRLASATMA